MAQSSSSIRYQHLEPHEHLLARPTIYIGSVEKQPCLTWTVNEHGEFEKRTITYTPALYKIIDEILVNAVDHVQRLSEEGASNPEVCGVKNIKVEFNINTGEFSVFNDGDGIDVDIHETLGVYVPEMIFGKLLTSSNYDDTKDRFIGGQNGIGAKACNIFSKEFTVETVDRRKGLLYMQTFKNNMTVRSEPLIKKYSKKPYTKITFTPDYERLSSQGLDEDMCALLRKRCYDLCALTPKNVNVYMNGEKLDCKDFECYVNLYIGKDSTRVVDQVADGWDVVIAQSADGVADQVSFVNGIWTVRGGKHVDAVVNIVASKLADVIAKKRKVPNIKPTMIKNQLMVFLRANVANPVFDTQSKETLVTPLSKLADKITVSDKTIEKLYAKSNIVAIVLEQVESADRKVVKKTDGRKVSRLSGILKLDDANLAGTSRSKDCTLILTEGDSAKTMALAGLSVVGRDLYGVFPLRGKLMNVHDATSQKITDNEEITNIKKILGLETGRTYTDTRELRYGRVMIMCDQDVDGSHIKGLLFNLFCSMWPSLLRCDGFITSMMTPIIKARAKGGQSVEFYNLNDYSKWKESLTSHVDWDIKYYKGLGTSTDVEARQYFRDLRVITYNFNDTSAVDLAFNKKRSDDRKEWLSRYERDNVIDAQQHTVSVSDFVHKELIHFSKYDVERSIPSMVDGLKVSQRKIMYACFKRNLEKEIKVAQLAGYVAEHSAYHHGDASLMSTIIGLAQDFVGANNVSLLAPIGQFGSRLHGGKDASQPRYINTCLNMLTKDIFKEDDMQVLVYLEDDGYSVEPEYYVPIIPMVLVNGAIGIGTGFSTNVPCYNPRDVINVVRCRMRGDDAPDIKPWYRGFKGEFVQDNNGKYCSTGCFSRVDDVTINVTELPVGMWTESFKELLEEHVAKGTIKAYKGNHTHVDVNFAIHFQDKATLDKLIEEDALQQLLKLSSNKLLNTNNMYLFDADGKITRYPNVAAIVDAFVTVRLGFYEKRKMAKMRSLENAVRLTSAKAQFVDDILKNRLPMQQLSKAELIALLTELSYPQDDDGTYDYLLRMPITSLNSDRRNELVERVKALESELSTLSGMLPTTLWESELTFLESRLDVFDAYLASLRDGDSCPSITGMKRKGRAPSGKRKIPAL